MSIFGQYATFPDTSSCWVPRSWPWVPRPRRPPLRRAAGRARCEPRRSHRRVTVTLQEDLQVVANALLGADIDVLLQPLDPGRRPLALDRSATHPAKALLTRSGALPRPAAYIRSCGELTAPVCGARSTSARPAHRTGGRGVPRSLRCSRRSPGCSWRRGCRPGGNAGASGRSTGASGRGGRRWASWCSGTAQSTRGWRRGGRPTSCWSRSTGHFYFSLTRRRVDPYRSARRATSSRSRSAKASRLIVTCFFLAPRLRTATVPASASRSPTIAMYGTFWVSAARMR